MPANQQVILISVALLQDSLSSMNNLVYLTYGQGPHIDELVFSVLSALHMIGPDSGDYRIIVYTDNPKILSDLPVQMELLSDKDLGEWAGPFGMNDRRKMFVVKNALQKFGGRIVFCDADTYFLKHPRKLFRRIHPGHTLLHIKEGHLPYCHAGELANFLERPHDLRTVTGRRWKLTQNTLMFNSGVIGMDEADISLLDEVIYLADQIYPARENANCRAVCVRSMLRSVHQITRVVRCHLSLLADATSSGISGTAPASPARSVHCFK